MEKNIKPRFVFVLVCRYRLSIQEIIGTSLIMILNFKTKVDVIEWTTAIFSSFKISVNLSEKKYLFIRINENVYTSNMRRFESVRIRNLS